MASRCDPRSRVVAARLSAKVESVARVFDLAVDASTASKCTGLAFISHNISAVEHGAHELLSLSLGRTVEGSDGVPLLHEVDARGVPCKVTPWAT